MILNLFSVRYSEGSKDSGCCFLMLKRVAPTADLIFLMIPCRRSGAYTDLKAGEDDNDSKRALHWPRLRLMGTGVPDGSMEGNFGREE